MSELYVKHCVPCEGGVPKLDKESAEEHLAELNEWVLDNGVTEIFKVFQFDNYYQTMAFVNALAWIAHAENHHPDLSVSYNQCRVRYSTHAIDGLSENDFICAAKVDKLLG